MKLFITSLLLILLTTSCSSRGNRAVYDMMHERERQECLKQGRMDCPKAESYDKYKQQRDEILRPEAPEDIKY